MKHRAKFKSSPIAINLRAQIRIEVDDRSGAVVTLDRSDGGEQPTELDITVVLAADPGPELLEEIRAKPKFAQPDTPLGDYFSEIRQELRAVAQDVVEAVVWRAGVDLPMPLMDVGSFEYELAAAWSRIPDPVSILVTRSKAAGVSSSIAPEIAALASARDSSIVAHRICWEAKLTARASPSTGLVLAVSALEVGLKNLVSKLVPEATWLVVETQSPPLRKMMQKFLPDLLAACEIQAGPIRGTVLKEVDEAVTERNRIVHRGEVRWDHQKVSSFVFTAQNLLYLFDCYAGRTWAIENVLQDLVDE